MAGKSTMRSEPDSMPRPRDKAIVRVSMLPRKSAKLNPQVPVPQTDTRSRDEYSKALE